jgi:putative transposase
LAYSEDLRKKVVEFIKEDEGGVSEAARLYKIGRATINRWLNLVELKPGKPGPKGPRKVNLDALKAEVDANPESYIAELAEKLQVSRTAICNNLKRLKLTRKKNRPIQRTKRGSAQ